MSATVKELLKSDSICQSCAQMKKGPVFYDLVYIGPICRYISETIEDRHNAYG